jgi:hypothetical protein
MSTKYDLRTVADGASDAWDTAPESHKKILRDCADALTQAADETERLRAELESAQAELDEAGHEINRHLKLLVESRQETVRLETIVDLLPKTEDRVPIYPGLEVFTTYDSGPVLVEAFHRCYSNRAWLIDTDRGPRMASECWSTSEAAEKARGK